MFYSITWVHVNFYQRTGWEKYMESSSPGNILEILYTICLKNKYYTNHLLHHFDEQNSRICRYVLKEPQQYNIWRQTVIHLIKSRKRVFWNIIPTFNHRKGRYGEKKYRLKLSDIHYFLFLLLATFFS